ncbi:MAG: lamin tail domain-containing protein, partial [Phycisphaerales bacterium]
MKCFHVLAAAALTLCAGAAANAQVVISQIYGGGGNSGSRWTNDFIELHNNSGSPVSLAGWSVQYSSQGASTWTATNLSGSIPAWGYYLVQEGPGAGGTEALPTPDASGAIPMNGTQAKVALVNTTTVLTDAAFTNASPDGTGPTIVDIVGYGTTSVARREGTANAPAPSNTASILRLNSGCTDTGQNGDDFVLSQGGATAIQPRNTSYAIFNCSGPSNDADIQASVVNNTGVCVQTSAYSANYVFTVTNAGPSNATSVSAVLTSASGATPNIVVSGGTYSNGTWTIGALNSGDSKTLTFTVPVNSAGATRAQLTATAAGNSDPDGGNNLAVTSNTFPDAVTAAKAVFRSASVDTVSGTFGQDTANIGATGFQFAGKTFAFGRPFFSPNGHRWIMVAEMANLLDSNSIIIVGNDDNYFMALQELPYGSGVDLGGGVKVFSSATQGSNSFDRAAAIDDAGNIAFSCQAVDSALDTSFSRAVVRGAPGANFGDPYSWTVVAYEGDAVPAAVNTAIGGSNRQWDGQMYVAGVSGSDVAFYAHLRAGTPALLNNADEVLVTANGTSVLATESVTVAAPTGFTLMGAAVTTNSTDKAFDQNTDANFSTRGFKRARTHWSSDAAIGRAATPTPAPTTADQVLVVDGTVVLREGDLLPGFAGLDTIAAANAFNNLTNFNSLSDDGTWYAYGLNAPVSPATRGTAWVVKGSGATVTVLAKNGDPIVPASSETWSNLVSGQTFLGVVGRGDDLVIWGLTSNGDSSRDAAVTWKNGSQNQVLLREGDPIDIGNPGSPNIVYCHSFIDSNRAAIDANRNLWIVAQTRNSQWACTLASADTLGQVFLKIALPAVSTNCPSISSEPSNQTVACNGTANFTVGVADAGAATYQWRKNGVALANG